tara:strand:- start:503 stop:856 length:354 start_codon:yes stop_codon:yes gene_type:complete
MAYPSIVGGHLYAYDIYCPNTEQTRSTFTTGEYQAGNQASGVQKAAYAIGNEGSNPLVWQAQGRAAFATTYKYSGTNHTSNHKGCATQKNGTSTCDPSEENTLCDAFNSAIDAYVDA